MEFKASFGEAGRIKCKQIKSWNLSRDDLIVSFAYFRYWEETEDAECKCIEACG